MNIWKQPALVIRSVRKGAALSLDDIENDFLRNPPLNYTEDVRLHACINCASISCPNLRCDLGPFLSCEVINSHSKGAYTVARLDQQMNESTINFLADPTKGSYVYAAMI